MRNVGEWPAVDEGGGTAYGLDEVGFDRLLEQQGHGTGGPQVVHGDRSVVAGIADGHAAEPGAQVLQPGGQAEYRHDLGSSGDLETGFPRHPVGRSAKADDHVAQRPVVHVHRAFEGDAPRINAQGISLVQVVVDQCHQQVVRAGYGMEIPGEMQVDLIHRKHLRLAAAGGPTLHAETRAHGGFTQGDHGFRSRSGQGITQAHHHGGFPFPRGCRGHAADQDHLSQAGTASSQQGRVDLGLVPAVRLHRSLRDPGRPGDLRNWLEHRSRGNGKITHVGFWRGSHRVPLSGFRSRGK